MTDKRNTQLDVVDSVQGEKPALKRTKHIDLGRMRKGFSVKPLALGVASVILSGCGGEKEDATIYTSLEDCKQDFPDAVERCEAAYQTAVDEAMRAVRALALSTTANMNLALTSANM